jgi:hypothetical protein
MPATEPAILNLQPPTESTDSPQPRAKGKIADLPKDQRDFVNRLLDDGATYRVVAAELAKLGVSLNPENISNWFNSGYQEHLRLLEWRAEIRSLRESAGGLPELNDAQQFQHTLVQLALTEIFRSLKQRQFEPDSPNYIRLFHALARLNREALVLRQYDDRRAKEQSAQPKPLDPNRDLEKERALMLAAMEQAFGFKAAPGPIGPAEISSAVPPAPVPANPPADFSLDRPDVQPTSSTEARSTDESINHPELSPSVPGAPKPRRILCRELCRNLRPKIFSPSTTSSFRSMLLSSVSAPCCASLRTSVLFEEIRCTERVGIGA